ncbi:MAG TPA: hypothetical protein VES68_03425 [Candidatus Sulfotelmatobacter sp.]|nr:hypothetical protein [Candidatus Sulfotelmatobacter sp.]
MRIEAGRTQYIEGFKINVEIVKPKNKTIPGGTAIHEAMHVVGAIENGTGVKSATIIPGDGYLGLTELSRPDAVAAMAPHSMGASGTGYDVYVAGLMGNAGSSESAARGIISANMDKVEAVATVLEEKGTITTGDINEAVDELKSPKPKIGTLSIQSKNGEQRKERVEIRDNIVIVPDKLIEIFSAKPQVH